MHHDDEHSIVMRQRLTADDLTELARLAAVCSRRAGCDLSFIAAMAAAFSGRALPQPFYYERGALIGAMSFQGMDEELEGFRDGPSGPPPRVRAADLAARN